MKRIFIDVETTGLYKNQHGIRQLSAIVEVPNEPLTVFDARINLKDKYIWDDYILENMATPEDYKNDQPMEEVFENFKSLLEEHCNPYHKKDKYLFYAYNAKFDEGFLRQFFYDNNDNYFGAWFFTPSIDIMSLAAERLKEVRPKMPDFKLETVAKELGINVREDMLHDSLYDIELTRKVYIKLTDEQTD